VSFTLVVGGLASVAGIESVAGEI